MVTNIYKGNILDEHQDFCLSKKLDIPLVTVTEVHNALKPLKQTGTRALDGVNQNFTAGSSHPSNYRPTSIVSVLSKPFENHMSKHLHLHLNKYNLLHSNQSGFRKKRSCRIALASLADQWLTTWTIVKLTASYSLTKKKKKKKKKKSPTMLLSTSCFSGNQLCMECQIVLLNILDLTLT